jgi:hypothetical protein
MAARFAEQPVRLTLAQLLPYSSPVISLERVHRKPGHRTARLNSQHSRDARFNNARLSRFHLRDCNRIGEGMIALFYRFCRHGC